jgi:hypothetical protein
MVVAAYSSEAFALSTRRSCTACTILQAHAAIVNILHEVFCIRRPRSTEQEGDQFEDMVNVEWFW